MVSSFLNPGFLPVHAHLTRLPVMDTCISVAIDSFEASMCVVVREAMDSTRDTIHKAVNPVL
ncbi:hypothetical protein D8674_034023 [Pyrus ussuriensis x Pyrus communis]|uniref:Uncharacterized protein n=1 Tax=Pyrus ussuriensis x Pyrus communis TaxID=2448454 RepID=A0A5N5HNP7_9ROSA|nr:hypothetical protein D8674_034023 [Pyrus ussuriensis x Pyrus communis]